MARQALAALGGGVLEGRPGLAGTILARDRLVPVGDQLASLFPGGGMRRGSTVCVAQSASAGSTSLAVALLAEPSKKGSWCAAVGLADLGLVAAAQTGADLGHLALVPFPGRQWPVVTAALLEGFDLVLVAPPAPAGAADARKLAARARERGSVLVVLGEWPAPPDVRVVVAGVSWQGLGMGAGYLSSCELEVSADGRGASSRPRRAYLRVG